MPDMTHYVKHTVDCPPDCDHDFCSCACGDHSPTCWPGRPDPACVCNSDALIEEDQHQ